MPSFRKVLLSGAMLAGAASSALAHHSTGVGVFANPEGLSSIIRISCLVLLLRRSFP
jgi:NAD-dependent oxidoreductase involved in siderophore biosynthesis